VDGNLETTWGAGDFAPQWLEIDLEAPVSVAEVRLLTGQDPAGQTTHRILVKGEGAGESFREVHKFSGATTDTQWLTVSFDEPLEGIRYVRVETSASPSWIAWREVEVIAWE
jgi:hypothetical protein